MNYLAGAYDYLSSAMARYPTFDDYKTRGNWSDGIKRCDDFLKKNPTDVGLLTTKLQLVFANRGDGQSVLDQVAAIQPPVQDVSDICAIEEAVVASQKNVFPAPISAGPAVTKLWDGVVKTSTNPGYKIDVLSLRFSRAIVDNRIADAQQALIQLKALQPKNRTIYMAHAAVTQMMSSSKEDLQSRLALGLAKKAVSEKFDEDKGLDCRVPGQIFAMLDSKADLETIKDRSFKESKQVYDALRQEKSAANGTQTTPATLSDAESKFEDLKKQFTALASSNTASEELVKLATETIQFFHDEIKSSKNTNSRSIANISFLAISELVKIFITTDNSSYLLQAAYVAEMMLRHDPHIHECRLILVYIYMCLGFGSLAMGMFDSLSVKEVQHDTIGHVLFTRLSTTHPFPSSAGRKDTLDNYKRLTQALSVYIRWEDKLADSQADVLSHRQTGMLFDLQELRNSLRSSLSRRITILALRRIARLADKHDPRADLDGPSNTVNWTTFTDSRDFNAAFDYNFNVERALHGPTSATPGKTWLLYTLAADSVWTYNTPRALTDPSTLLAELETLTKTLTTQTAIFAHGLTETEHKAGEIALYALHLLTAPTSPEETFTNLQKAIEALPIPDTTNSNPNDPNNAYTSLDALRTANHALNQYTKTSTSPSPAAAKLKTLVKTRFEAVQKHANEQKNRITITSIRELLASSTETWSALKLFGGDDVQVFCDDVAKFGREGWEGFGRIKFE